MNSELQKKTGTGDCDLSLHGSCRRDVTHQLGSGGPYNRDSLQPGNDVSVQKTLNQEKSQSFNTTRLGAVV